MNDKQHYPILLPERVEFVKKIESKKCVFDSLTNLLEKGQKKTARHAIFDALIAREKLGDTYIGNGIALPRATLEISRPRAAVLVLKQGISLGAADKKPIHVFLGLLIPKDDSEAYSERLAAFIKKVLIEENLPSIIQSGNAELVSSHFNALLATNNS